MSRSIFFRILCFLLLAGSASHAQSLADVLSSIQERKQVIEQRKQVETHLQRTYTSSQPAILDQVLIVWEGLPSAPFPTDSHTAALSIDARINLLNQAIRELRALQPQFLNFRKEDLSTNAQAGALRPYMLEDFPELGRANAANYHQLLRLAAQSVRKLSVLDWPLAGLKNVARKILYPAHDEKPPSIGVGTVDEQGTWETSVSLPLIERCHFWHNTEVNNLKKEEFFFEKFGLFATVPDRHDQLGGKAAVVFRNHWSPVPDSSVDVTAPTAWEPDNSSVQIAMTADDPLDEYPVDAPQVVLTLAYNTIAFPSGGVYAWAYPAGYQLVDPEGNVAENSWELLLCKIDIPASPGSNSGYYVMGRRMYALFTPDFTKGLDSEGKAALLNQSERTSVTTAGDAVPILHPTSGMLMAVPLGCGLDGGTMGYVGITLGEVDSNLIRYSTKHLGVEYSLTDLSPSSSELANRFDYTASLRFIGPVQDFHVVYETSRELTKRGAELPPEVPTTQQIADMGCRFFFRNWDLPRLKQVVSRDFVVNISPHSHYKNEVRIYRRPTNAGAMDRTPGITESVDEANLIRVLIFENPDTDDNPYPDTPEKLHITEEYSDTVYRIWRTGYPSTAQKNPSGIGVVHPDIHFEIKDGETVRYSKVMDFQGIGHVVTSTTVDGVTISTKTINDQDWAWYRGMEPSHRQIVRGTQTTVVANTFAANPTPWSESSFRNAWHPLTSEITITSEPTTNLAWNTSGRLTSAMQGAWRTDSSIDNNVLKSESKFDSTRYATTWTEWSNHDRTIKQYTAPDGEVSSKAADETDWIQLTLGNASGTGLPGLPHQLSRKDGTGTSWSWTVAGDHSGSLTVQADTQTQTSAWNSRSYPISSQTSFVADGTVTVANSAVPSGETTDWGAPKKWKDQLTGLSTLISHENQLNRPTSVTSPLGLTTEYSNYDVFNRPGQVESNGITANHTFSGLNMTTAVAGAATGNISHTRDAAGRLTASNTTWNGVTNNLGIDHGVTSTTIAGNHSLLGSSETTVRKDDGSLASSEGTTRPFGGVSGDTLSIVNGLLVTKTAVTDLPGTFAETHTDAWGRAHKIITPSRSGSGSTTTLYEYSNPSAPVKRVITTEPTGRVLITESEANGTITRSGIDVNGNGELGASDRYTESITTVDDGKIVTILRITDDSGMREIMNSEWTPSSGITVTKINGNEEIITTAPDYSERSVTTSSSKGWNRTTAINALGLSTSNTLKGTGISDTELKPVWRADGSLASVELEIVTGPNNQKETHTASFNLDGTLSNLTAPGRGNILGEHTISNGMESLTVNGVTNQAALDGTSQSTSGANVINRSDTLTIEGGEYKNRSTSAVGAPTDTFYNSAAAPTAKTYADASGETYGYIGELLTSISLARGGALALDYSNDGAKDLTSATWPAMDSGAFTIPGIAHGFAYSRSGNIKTFTDPSGTRSLNYLNGRLSGTTYTAGLLRGYEIILGRDTVGRHTGTLLKRDGNTIHTTAIAPNGASDQITDLASGNITATPQRDGAGRISGYLWNDGTNTVTQTWTRGPGGRIEFAGSDVSGAPSFNYLINPEEPEESFDGFARRLKCETAGGVCEYTYGIGGQLTSASHPTLGTFTYQFDEIGRRTDMGTSNTTDILNQTTAWTHDQSKTLTIKAHPNARVWFNGVELQNFTGQHQAALTPPGTEGGWVPWKTLAILEGAGDGAGNPPVNPLASPDAKAEKRGAVWVPPTNEEITYDAAGNRQSSSQWDFGWDAKNQLARVRTKNHTTAAQAYDITYSYDAEGRRVRKHVVEYLNGSLASEKIVTFVWDGWNLLYERHKLPSGLTLLERKYLWGPDIADGSADGAGGLLLIRETKGDHTTEIIPLYDGGGNVIALTDIHKNLLAEYYHGPFGEKISAMGSHAQSNPWRWATKYQEEETSLYYFGHRYYDPITGQFLSRDSLGESESINLYSYAGNDPINFVDVLGLAKVGINQADQKLIELALRYGLINQDAGFDAVIDTAVLNSLLTANGETPIDFIGGLTVNPTIICHGRSSRGNLAGVSRLYSMVNGQVHSSSGNGDMMRKIGAGAWGNTRGLPGDLGNLAAYLVNGAANAIGDVYGFESGTHPAFYQMPIDADGWRSAGQQQVYPGICSNNLIVGAGGALADAVFLFAAPEVLLAKAPGWSVPLAPRLNPANYHMPLGQLNMGIPMPRYVPRATVGIGDDAGCYIYRTISPDDPHFVQFANIGDSGVIRPRGGHNDLTRHVQMNDTDSIFTSWSKNEPANWDQWNAPGHIQLRIDTRTLQNPALDVSRWSSFPWELEISVIGDLRGAVRVR